jgi:pyruvate dehydrogenase E2 component (dihydrolipoamide acetyltransferase)
VYKKDVNIANAVAIDGGLITPVLKNANLKDIMSISADWKVPQILKT